jgi:hypothetical protein
MAGRDAEEEVLETTAWGGGSQAGADERYALMLGDYVCPAPAHLKSDRAKFW